MACNISLLTLARALFTDLRVSRLFNKSSSDGHSPQLFPLKIEIMLSKLAIRDSSGNGIVSGWWQIAFCKKNKYYLVVALFTIKNFWPHQQQLDSLQNLETLNSLNYWKWIVGKLAVIFNSSIFSTRNGQYFWYFRWSLRNFEYRRTLMYNNNQFSLFQYFDPSDRGNKSWRNLNKNTRTKIIVVSQNIVRFFKQSHLWKTSRCANKGWKIFRVGLII